MRANNGILRRRLIINCDNNKSKAMLKRNGRERE